MIIAGTLRLQNSAYGLLSMICFCGRRPFFYAAAVAEKMQ
jgi:hypothetical protein